MARRITVFISLTARLCCLCRHSPGKYPYIFHIVRSQINTKYDVRGVTGNRKKKQIGRRREINESNGLWCYGCIIILLSIVAYVYPFLYSISFSFRSNYSRPFFIYIFGLLSCTVFFFLHLFIGWVAEKKEKQNLNKNQQKKKWGQ